MVLAQVAGGWQISRQFHDQILWPAAPEARACLEPYQPRFEHAVFDLAGIDVTRLRGGPMMRLTLALLKVRTEPSDEPWLTRVIPLLDAANQAISDPKSLLPLYRYLLFIASLSFEEFRAKILESSRSSDTAQRIMSTADQLINQGRQEGREQGRQEALVSQVQMLQDLVGRAADPASALTEMRREQLEAMVVRLKDELNARLK
jgi:hypothetical protein